MEQTQEVKEFAAYFKPEEFEILAVTDSLGWGGSCRPGEQYYTASIKLIAWKRFGESELYIEPVTLTMKADQVYLEKLRQAAPCNHVIRVKVRQDQNRFLVCARPELAADAQLAAVLAERQKPVCYEDAVLGRFELDRGLNWFTGNILWNHQQVRYEFDNGEQTEMHAALEVMHILLKHAAEWDQKIRGFAAEHLLDLKNDTWLDEDEAALTMEEFASRLVLQSIDTNSNGQFTFWFNDDDMFWGHAVVVTGTLQDGLQTVSMEG